MSRLLVCLACWAQELVPETRDYYGSDMPGASYKELWLRQEIASLLLWTTETTSINPSGAITGGVRWRSEAPCPAQEALVEYSSCTATSMTNTVAVLVPGTNA